MTTLDFIKMPSAQKRKMFLKIIADANKQQKELVAKAKKSLKQRK